jgi:putative glutamine amidotransferase
MKKPPYRIIFCFLISFLFSFAPVKEKPLKVALTKASPNYINWIKKGDTSVIVVDLNNLKPMEAIQELHNCAGLVLTGGGDIDPSMYQNADKEKVCNDIDLNRDILEKAIIDEALALKMPILGICRGEQMLNVFTGGSLIIDIPTYMKMKNQVIHQCDDYLHCYHTVRLDSTSLLRSIIGFDSGFVTSNHHQAIERLGNGLRENARSPDAIIEGIEWKDTKGKSFMVGVQWHPERMDTSNAFSGKLLQRFIAESQKFASNIKNVK